MSPLEIARAFNAPMLADQNSNAVSSELVRGAGERPVRYGLVSSRGVAVENSEPQIWKDGELLEMKPIPSRSTSPGVQQQHLEIADARVVEPLRQ